MKQLTPKHKQFADQYLKHGNGTKAVQDVFGVKNYNYARVKASRLLTIDNIRSYMDGTAQHAVTNIVHLADNASSDYVRLKANQDILDRAGYKA